EDRPAGSNEILWRSVRNPIAGRNPTPNGHCVYNSAVVRHQDRFVGVFRIDSMNLHPSLHLGHSDDGYHWSFDHDPIEFAGTDGRPFRPTFAYDPRVTPVDDGYVIAWCNDFHGPTVALARTADFQTFEYLGNSFVPYNRNGVLFPKRIGGLYTMLHRPSDSGHTPFGSIFLSRSPDLRFWGDHRWVMDPGSTGWWDSTKIGAGPVPIETESGWLMIYHGVISTCNGFSYSIGAALLDLEEPWKVVARSGVMLLSPETDYEVSGRVPNVCFPCAALVDEPTGRLALYYGAADTHTAIAFGYVHELVAFVKNNNCTN
ncbi:MAG: glycoside hydrolase family 130 protein, partial [Planctomycetota bacterium]